MESLVRRIRVAHWFAQIDARVGGTMQKLVQELDHQNQAIKYL
jgi:hypothetical protein